MALKECPKGFVHGVSPGTVETPRLGSHEADSRIRLCKCFVQESGRARFAARQGQ